VVLNDFIKKFGGYRLHAFYRLTNLCKIYQPAFEQATAVRISMTPNLFYHVLHADAAPFVQKLLERNENF